MNKLDLVKQKVSELKRREAVVSNSEQIINALSGIYKNSLKEVKEDVSDNNLAFFKQLSKNIEDKISDKDDALLKSIDKLGSSLSDSTKASITKELRSLVLEIKSFSTKNSFDQEAFNNSFIQAIEKINNLIIANNDVPNKTVYVRDKNGNIVKITEQFDNFTLIHTWNYDNQLNLSSVSTVKTNNE